MTSPSNSELVAAVARRPDSPAPPVLEPTQALVVDWNHPIDTIAADALTERAWIRGRIAQAKAVAAAWTPRQPPS